MALVHLKCPLRQDGNKALPAVAPGGAGPEYSYGMVLRMENFEIDQMGIKQMPKVGQEVTITAKAKVTRVAESASPANKGDRNLELQVTHLEMTGIPGKVERKEAADRQGRPDEGGKARVGQVANSSKAAGVGAVRSGGKQANVGKAGNTDSAFAE